VTGRSNEDSRLPGRRRPLLTIGWDRRHTRLKHRAARGPQEARRAGRQTRVDVVIQAADRPALGPRLGRLLFQRVCATGPVEKHDRGFFVLSTPAQLVLQQPGLDVSPRFGEAYTICDEGVTFPELVREVKPNYTPEAMRALKQGKVLLHAVVLPNGRVGDVVVTVSLDKDYGLDAQAVRALKGWRFKPATRLGQPVRVVVAVELTFTLRARSGDHSTLPQPVPTARPRRPMPVAPSRRSRIAVRRARAADHDRGGVGWRRNDALRRGGHSRSAVGSLPCGMPSSRAMARSRALTMRTLRGPMRSSCFCAGERRSRAGSRNV